MERIRFYYKGEFLAQAELTEKSMTADRHRIAKGAGVKIYDRMQFITTVLDDKGSIIDKVRMDTDELGDLSFLKHELNVWI